MANIVKSLVEGGKATAGPPLGPALGPLGVNIGQIVKEINEKTKLYEGMQVPVTIKVDTATKKFEIEVGTPPASSLIIKELKVEKGSGNAKAQKIGDLKLEQVYKIAKMKIANSLSYTLKGMALEVIGSCVSLGVTVEGADPREIQKKIKSGEIKVPES